MRSHCCKSTPSGEIYRHRSHLCVDSSQQQYRIASTNTYSPAVSSWTTVRILLILSVILNLKSRSVDYVQAFFPQASLPEDENVHMAIPGGYTISSIDSSTCLKLKKNLYGLKQTAHENWNELLTSWSSEKRFYTNRTLYVSSMLMTHYSFLKMTRSLVTQSRISKTLTLA